MRTKVKRVFPSLWQAIYENAISRIYLGVHWRFDAADASDVVEADGSFKTDAAAVSYKHVWQQKRLPGEDLPVGGVPLGLGIANDIWDNQMKAPLPASNTKTTAAPAESPAALAPTPDATAK